jgi:hypothetical protein
MVRAERSLIYGGWQGYFKPAGKSKRRTAEAPRTPAYLPLT